MFAVELCLLVFLFVGASLHPQETKEKIDEERGKKRRIQNSEAAKKSYEHKKKERQMLQQKNTELVEAQKKLLRDNSHLQEYIILLSHIAASICHTCTSQSEQDTKPQTEVSTNRVSATPRRRSGDASNEALDLSTKSSRSLLDSSFSPQVPKEIKCIPFIKRTSSSQGEYVRETSSMEIGGAGKDGLVPSVHGGNGIPEMDKIEQENGIFIPVLKKIKCE